MMTGQLEDMIADTRQTRLEPKAFFVAWRGVLTLAFTGFPVELVELKQRLDTLPLRRENQGSKWPKMTLGALADDSKVLTADQLSSLSTLCSQMSTNLNLLADDFAVTRLSFVLFSCRSLERILLCHEIPLRDDGGLPDALEVPADQIRAVDQVMAESDDKSGYLVEVAKPGNRAAHYQGDHSEATLVAFVGNNPDVKMILDQFREAVDFLLPGYYTWFRDDALHCTHNMFQQGLRIRSIVRASGLPTARIAHQRPMPAMSSQWPQARGQSNRNYNSNAHQQQQHQESDPSITPPTSVLILAGGYFALINVAAAGLFWYDKHQANTKGWRVPEKQLQLTALLGGWVGGQWAMQTFRHKTVKKAFKEPYNLAMGANMVILGGVAAAWMAMPRFRRTLQSSAKSLGL
ncbi:hypothetical protein HDU77_002517 [Chytriomyces hyalinus]|nr:hypothetical protein HDU77_002517 [Chytriomyces hyalinus]